MGRCSRCNGRLSKKETVCFGCGEPVVEMSGETTMADRLRFTLKIMFFFSAGLTLASLFTDYVPSFWKCAASTVILHLVKSSADSMSETRS